MDRLKTNWYIITGGPCSGKTKIIEYLSFLGYSVIPEIARILIDVETSKGKSVEEVRYNELEFQKKVLDMKIKVENRIPCEQITFFDRGIPDTIAYDQMYGVNTDGAICFSQKREYKGVFLLKQVLFQTDYARTEDQKFADGISKSLHKVYSDLGYNVVDVPIMPIDERVQYILKIIQKSRK